MALSEALARIPGTDAYSDIFRMAGSTITFLETQHARFGKVSRSRLIEPSVLLVGPEANRTVMVTRRDDFSYRLGYGRISLAPLFEDSILLLDGSAHARVRAILDPAMAPPAIAEALPLVEAAWKRVFVGAPDESRDVYDLALAATYEAATSALTGLTDVDELERSRHDFERLILGSTQILPIAYPGGLLARGLRARKRLVHTLAPHVAEARRGSQRGMLGLLARHHDANGDTLSDEEIVRHTLLLFWAGYDTTASTGAWAVHVLADRPDLLAALRDEAFTVLGERAYTQDDQAKLVKLGWFLREIERLYPSILLLPRRTTSDVEVLGFTVPKDTAVAYSPYMSHLLPELFERPREFDPSRWDPARGEKAARAGNLFGFGGGPRLCLGRNFALMQLRVMLTTLVRRFDVVRDARSTFRTQMVPTHHPVASRVFLRPV